MAEFKKVGVVGCGLMGGGITQVVARHGFSVVVREVSQEVLDRGLARIRGFLERSAQKGRIDAAEKDRVMERITPTTRMENLCDCDLIIEAITEKAELKKAVFSQIDSLALPEAIFASSTSAISICELASVTNRPRQFVGMHFFNPVPVMKLVELVRTYQTTDETYSRARGFAESLGKVVITSKDRPGFIVNLLLVPYLLCAIRALENGISTKEDIDAGMKIGCHHPMGPFELLDFVGLDTTLYIAECMYDEFKDRQYAPPPLLRRMVTAGHHGRKTGRGFYEYE